MSKLSQRLDAVSKARQAYVLARTTLEQRLRDEMREELSNLQTQVDMAVRYAFDGGESKAAIMRAMGTKDYGTMNASLERTKGVTEIVGNDPLGSVYEYSTGVGDGLGILYVDYDRHGPSNYTGKASFTVKEFDGKIFLIANESLWNDDYTVRNDAVAALDGKTDGFYYDEVIEWISQQLSE